MKKHECIYTIFCTCDPVFGTEPAEDCPIHAGYTEWHPKCDICGRFIKRRKSWNRKKFKIDYYRCIKPIE